MIIERAMAVNLKVSLFHLVNGDERPSFSLNPSSQTLPASITELTLILTSSYRPSLYAFFPSSTLTTASQYTSKQSFNLALLYGSTSFLCNRPSTYSAELLTLFPIKCNEMAPSLRRSAESLPGWERKDETQNS